MSKIELFGLKKYKIVILGLISLILIFAGIFYYLQWQDKKEDNNLETCISAARQKFINLYANHKERYPDDESCKADPVGCVQGGNYALKESKKIEDKCYQIYPDARERKSRASLDLCLKNVKETIKQNTENGIPSGSLDGLYEFCYRLMYQ